MHGWIFLKIAFLFWTIIQKCPRVGAFDKRGGFFTHLVKKGIGVTKVVAKG